MPERLQRHPKSKRASQAAACDEKMTRQALQRPLEALLRLPKEVAVMIGRKPKSTAANLQNAVPPDPAQQPQSYTLRN